MTKLTIGVLGLQGAIEEHVKHIHNLGLQSLIVKKPEQLKDVNGLILPGGESTTMRKLIDRYGFFEPLKEFSNKGIPIFGTCAGMVLIAKEIIDSNTSHLNLMDISVKRNAFGRQVDSFVTALDVRGLNDPFNAIFIRAPYIESAGKNVEILATYDGKIVAAKQDHILVSSFHPELTDDNRFLELFVEMVKEQKVEMVK
ncbi:pyridoxal 5'-phosphate synthase glutaminase subunit PdxT [Bacilli bacterium]|uniref:pyridoxal 5'-phosphate synthase glutaminase subunit PdxT n=1 Tax=Oceanobacillus caeni TaxID=405946 RepID=UPI0006225C92|nr:glutamine amidotransferase [Bacilli bacterium VT-13-104]PZD85042.1 pyridoxal 5'-phosphate synthase glutaminase subunit PdxT [Bacilli bacterium]PZD85897.1 pyridoxal 5'-phosphate synthase glutaminase subunit PdxT [Bacilli bacterium]PZD89474.1 pyridoxal 5'-phosphate synthase glutaminase subunit PdxT [Bacilli bacterium]RCO06069.1 pyridoxal 5'-phosphate synthase glutaminase subunit PdxT [Bacilli bacterium]